jgi:hypothetical protein
MSKTVKARIALVINERGQWNSYGSFNCSDRRLKEFAKEFFDLDYVPDCEQMYFIEVEVPVPEVKRLEGKLEEDKSVGG